MSSTTIEKILLDAKAQGIGRARTLESLSWFMNKSRVAKVSDNQLIREFGKNQFRNSSQLEAGSLYMFYYDPKHKKTLPYYDTFPCVWVLNINGDGSMLGLNLHYLPYALRAKLMDHLLTLENDARMDKNKKLNLSYGILKAAGKSKLYAPCIKKYLFPHMRSKLIKMDYADWPVAAFLPVHSFNKATASEVWADSKKK